MRERRAPVLSVSLFGNTEVLRNIDRDKNHQTNDYYFREALIHQGSTINAYQQRPWPAATKFVRAAIPGTRVPAFSEPYLHRRPLVGPRHHSYFGLICIYLLLITNGYSNKATGPFSRT